MNEFIIVKKYLKSLTRKNINSLNLDDDIFFHKRKKIAISVDTYVEGVHFLNSKDPDKFLKKILRASLSDLYCKGVKPSVYFLSFALNKSLAKNIWLKKIKKILTLEQNKFDIYLGGGDTTYSPKLVITISVLGITKNKPVLRNGSFYNDDIYITGNIGDSYLGLKVVKGDYDFLNFNNFFKKRYYEPILPIEITPYLKDVASASIDISDGVAQDLRHLCKLSKCGANINLNNLPISAPIKNLIQKKKINLTKVFSNGDDYQILFTSKQNNRSKITNLSKKIKLKISRIGNMTKNKNIIFNHNNKKLKIKASRMGYTHNFK
jgi:thiamine-monophosphate kinase